MEISGVTIALQAFNFLVLVFLLHRFFWKPVKRAIDKRQKEVSDETAAAKAQKAEAEALRVEYAEKLASVDRERAARIAELKEQIEQERESKLAMTREQIAKETAFARQRLEEERRAALSEITKDSISLAAQIAQKLLSEVRSPAIAGAFFDRVCEHIDALPPEELSRLRKDAESGIQIATAAPLESNMAADFRSRITKQLGKVDVSFVTDPSLLSGVELRALHLRIGHSFLHSISVMERELIASAHETSHDDAR